MRYHRTKAALLALGALLCEVALFAGVTLPLAAAYLKLPPETLLQTALHTAPLVIVWMLIVWNIPSLVAALVGTLRARLAW